MDQIFSIAREAIIVLALIAFVFGVGFGLLRLRRAMGGGLDDHLRMSTSQTLAKVAKILLTITAVLWVVVFILMRDEYGDNLGQALDQLMNSVVPTDMSAEPDSSPPSDPQSPAPPTR